MIRCRATEVFAERLFVAEHGATGLSWGALAQDEHDEWRRRAGHLLEALFDGRNPYVILDLANDELWLTGRVEQT